MKVFVLKKNSIIFYALLFVLSITIVATNWDEAGFVFGTNIQNNNLPIYSVDKGEEKICAISFDAAWGNEDTPLLIEILDKYKIKTTFFVVGSWVDKYPESVKALSDAGHEIMNHSNTHAHMTKISSEKMKEEVTKCSEKIKAITKKEPNLFRPPYGDYNSEVINEVEKLSNYVIQWSVDSLDWKDYSPDDIYKRVVTNIHPGAIVLFHNAAKNTPEALKKILPKLIEDGYKIVPVSQIIMKDNYKIDHTGKQIEKPKE